MSGMLKDFINVGIEEKLKKDYPHVLHPTGVYAKVVHTEKNGLVTECVLKLLNEDLTENKNFPEIPRVRTNEEIKAGDRVAVVKMYAGGYFIIGRCV